MENLFRRMVWNRLTNIIQGQLVLREGALQRVFGRGGENDLTATVEVFDPRFYRMLVLDGSLGAAEAYISGYWACADLVPLVRIFCRNEGLSKQMEGGPAHLLNVLHRIPHWMKLNTVSGSRRNIATHYDLGNEFFSLFLDETLSYSCAIFPGPESTLLQASGAKLNRICKKLNLSPKDRVLEIGAGWGGFALYAAEQYGCHITTTTISRKQYDFAKQRVSDAGLEGRVTVLMEDYRKLAGKYDKIVSIEMIEAVGHRFFDTYFGKCSGLLKPDGMMLLQAIVIPDQRYEQYRRSVDFIQKYIFPGGCLPSLGAICGSVGRATDLRLSHMEDITAHYAETLKHWRLRFRHGAEDVRKLGFTEEFIRTWEFYFCYCEGGFRECAIGDLQLVLKKPFCRSTVETAYL